MTFPVLVLTFAYFYFTTRTLAQGEFEAYVPYKEHSPNNDFIKFYKMKNTLFGKDISSKKTYQ